MKKIAYSVLLLALLCTAFVAGTWYTRGTARTTGSRAGAHKILYYVDPMHPAYKSADPGIAPDCGMELVAVYADGNPGGSGSSLPSQGLVRISAEKQQLIGVRVSQVEETSGKHTVRLFGRVAADEARTYKLNAGIEGYIQNVSPVTTGSQVTKDQVLATFSAPMSTMAIQTYILNLGAEDRFKKSAAEGSPEGQSVPAANANIQQRIQQLRNIGMSSMQIAEIKRTREIPESIKIVAPVNGFVLARNVSPGQNFERGVEWYRIADLSRVWILVDVFEDDAQYLRPGSSAKVHLRGEQKSFHGTVSEILPQVDANSRTLKMRLEADNPGYLLRPDMFVDVELPVTFHPAITVPVDAVLDSGRSKTVFVEREQGVFEPRTVETGWRSDERVEIVKGLMSGERIVIAGNFLISSESQLKGAAPRNEERLYSQQDVAKAENKDTSAVKKASMSSEKANVKDPACGMEVNIALAKAAGHTSKSGGAEYYFCSDKCKRDFDADPAHFVNKLATPTVQHADADARRPRG